ncbi:hypothetical protein Tco_0802785 [Tanacetum coccineum]|uniref:Uncharacterized protein n=1 Tax=Tanacetum coccineum TaxID=301880 RepID=A0ABQ5A3V5_9ASTR
MDGRRLLSKKIMVPSHLKIILYLFILRSELGPIWDQSYGIKQGSNRELGGSIEKLKDGITEMKIGFADKFQHLEDIVTKLSDAVLSGKGGDNYKEAGSKPMVAVVYQEEGKEVTWEIFYEEVQRIMRTLMKLFQGYNKRVPFESIKRSLRGWK